MTVYRHTLRHAPIGLWQFDGSLADSSGNGFTLAVETGSLWYTEIAPGVRGAYFDGSTQLIYNTFNTLLDLMGDFTIEFLIQLTAYPGTNITRSLVSHGASGETAATNYAYLISLIGGNGSTTAPIVRTTSESGAGVNADYSITASPVIGAVSHVAVTRKANVIQHYLNGNAWGAASGTLTAPTRGETGRFRVGDPATTSYVPNCVMASLKVLDKALTAAEIKAEYGRTLGPQYSQYSPPSNLDVEVDDTIAINDAVGIPVQYHDKTHSPVGLWQFNGVLTDSSGNGFTLTVATGTERYSEVMPGMTGVYLDGSTTIYRNANETLLTITGDLTIEMILLMPVAGATMAICSHGDNAGTSASNYLWDILTNGTWSLSFFSESGTKTGATLPRPLASLSYNMPCHFAMTRTSNVIQFWLNGAVIGTSGSQTAPTGGTLGKLRIGGEAASSSMVGCVASLKIISSALNSTQIAAEYARTVGRYYDSLVTL